MFAPGIGIFVTAVTRNIDCRHVTLYSTRCRFQQSGPLYLILVDQQSQLQQMTGVLVYLTNGMGFVFQAHHLILLFKADEVVQE